MKNIIALEIEMHELFAQKYLRLASDNLAVAMSEDGSTEVSRERKQAYLGYAEDYSLLAHKELTKAYLINRQSK
jgi:hypothetical protein